MKEIEIEQPHGYLLDADGKVFKRFGNWDTEQRQSVPDIVESVEYVNGPAEHDKKVDSEYSGSE